MGLGNNSVALMIKKVELNERVDLILFADTGGEKPWTYEYLGYFSKWLTDRGYPEITVVKKVKRNGEIQTLEENCIEQKMLPSIAYGFKSCSHKFKIQPQDKYCNNWKPAKDFWKAGGKVTKLIGIHAGEAHRAKFTEDKKYIYKYPLIEWDFDGDQCVSIIKEAGLKVPEKSACYFCPSSKKHEILSLPQDLKDRAIAMEENAKLTTIKGLGRNFAWKNLIRADKEQMRLFDDIDVTIPDIDCICLDGD